MARQQPAVRAPEGRLSLGGSRASGSTRKLSTSQRLTAPSPSTPAARTSRRSLADEESKERAAIAPQSLDWQLTCEAAKQLLLKALLHAHAAALRTSTNGKWIAT